MRTIHVALALFLSAFLLNAAEAQWLSWQGPTLDNKSPDTGLLKQWPAAGPKLLWKTDGIGQGFSTVAVANGMIYTTGDLDGKLTIFAFDSSGKPEWSKPHDQEWANDPGGSRSTPTIDSGKLYILSAHGLIGCYNAKTGEKIWTRRMQEFGGSPHGWGYAESVLIQGKLALVTPGGKNCIVALDKTTGQTVWMSKGFSAPPNYGSLMPFTFQGVPLIVAGTGGGLFCVDARNGQLQWSNDFCAGNTANCPTPAYSNGYVFWANGYGKGGICMKLKKVGNKVDADVAWTTGDMDCHHGGYVILDGYIYGNNGGGWTCLKLTDGTKTWNDRGVGKGSICYADGMLYLFSENSGQMGLASFSPQGMQLKGKFNVRGEGPSWAHPVVVGGRLYLRYDQNLYCFDVKNQGRTP